MKWLKITKIYASVCAFCIVGSEIYRFLNTFLLKSWFIAITQSLSIIFQAFNHINPVSLSPYYKE